MKREAASRVLVFIKIGSTENFVIGVSPNRNHLPCFLFECFSSLSLLRERGNMIDSPVEKRSNDATVMVSPALGLFRLSKTCPSARPRSWLISL